MSEPKAAPEKMEINLTAVRNGDRLGHDHLDSIHISAGGYTIDVNDAAIVLTLPDRINSSYSGIYANKPTYLRHELIIDSMGRVTQIFYHKSKSNE